MRVTARVRNAGRAAAPATVARLYDGDPASSPVARRGRRCPPLAPGEEAEVAFDYPTADRAGPRTLYVVADAAGQVRESREDDNTASRALTVEGLLADLEVLADADIVIAPAVPEVGEATAISVTVAQPRRAGRRRHAPSASSVTDPSGASVRPAAGRASPPSPPGQAATVSRSRGARRRGRARRPRHGRRRATRSRSRTRRTTSAERAVRVVEQRPGGRRARRGARERRPPARSRSCRRRSRSGPSSRTRAARPRPRPSPCSTRRTGETARRPRRVDVRRGRRRARARPGDGHDARARGSCGVVVDPDDQVAEADEDDNVAAVGLAGRADARPRAGRRRRPLAADVEVGEPVTVTAEVRNRGTIDVALDPGPARARRGRRAAELARTTLDLPAGRVADGRRSRGRADAHGRRRAPRRARRPLRPARASAARTTTRPRSRSRVRPSGLPNLAVSGADVAFDPDPPVEGRRGDGLRGRPQHGRRARGPVRRAVLRRGSRRARARRSARRRSPALGAGRGHGPSRSRGRPSTSGARSASSSWPTPSAEVEESDETDNRAFRPFSAVGLPDLVLTAADVVLEPGYPRAGEAVTIRATVRNLGGQPSAATTLWPWPRASRRAGRDRHPGRAGPRARRLRRRSPSPGRRRRRPGERPLSLAVDPDGARGRAGRGQQLGRVGRVVVQDADLYLTEPVLLARTATA